MTRVKRGSVANLRRKKILKLTKGFVGSHSKLFSTANQQTMKAHKYAYNDRRKRKSQYNRLWIVRINSLARLQKRTYSYERYESKQLKIILNRKMLSEDNLRTVYAPIVFSLSKEEEFLLRERERQKKLERLKNAYIESLAPWRKKRRTAAFKKEEAERIAKINKEEEPKWRKISGVTKKTKKRSGGAIWTAGHLDWRERIEERMVEIRKQRRERVEKCMEKIRRQKSGLEEESDQFEEEYEMFEKNEYKFNKFIESFGFDEDEFNKYIQSFDF